jgi:hypothetical protein
MGYYGKYTRSTGFARSARLMLSQYPGRCYACGCRFPADTEIMWTRGDGAKHSTEEACARARAALSELPKSHADLRPVVDFLTAAQVRGLKRPKLRLLAPDRTSELTLSLTTRGQEPGSVNVKLDGSYIGVVRKSNGDAFGRLLTPALCAYLSHACADPIAAVRDYAALRGVCAFCGLALTDAGSTRVGYGPVCAKHWGLPHHAEGTPELGVAPTPTPAAAQRNNETGCYRCRRTATRTRQI